MKVAPPTKGAGIEKILTSITTKVMESKTHTLSRTAITASPIKQSILSKLRRRVNSKMDKPRIRKPSIDKYI